MAKYDSILETIGHTPVVKLDRLAPAASISTSRSRHSTRMGSVKDRLALGVIEDAERAASSRPGRPSSRPRAAIPGSAWPWSAPTRAIRWS